MAPRSVGVVLMSAPMLATAFSDVVARAARADTFNVIPHLNDGGFLYDNEEVVAYVTQAGGGWVCVSRPGAVVGGGASCAWGKTSLGGLAYAGPIGIRSGGLPPGDWQLLGLDGGGQITTAASESFSVQACATDVRRPPSLHP